MHQSPYFAAVDLGSNSFHMIIGRFNDGQFEIIDREKEMVQIARGLQGSGKLDEAAQQRAFDCLLRFSERLRDIPEEQVRAVGTKTLRSAKNSSDFLTKAEEALGHAIEIISGYEEARLVYQGLAHSIVDKQRHRLVIDIGGGSTEFIIGQHNQASLLESLSMGCVSFTNRYFADHLSTGESLNKCYLAACVELESIRLPYLNEGWDLAFGTSGTMKAVAALLNDNGASLIQYDKLCKLMQQLSSGVNLDDSDIPKLRREVLPAGVAIIKAICDQLKIDTIHVSDASLKEGLIYDTQDRLSLGDVREQSVQQLMQRFAVDQGQAERVCQTALNLWKQIQEEEPRLHSASRSKVLRWSALLHEIGLSISHSGYHRHGHYLAQNSDIAGFGRLEQFCIASLLRFQRKKIKAEDFASITPNLRPAFNQLLLCLRLAVRLNRRREDMNMHLQLKLVNGSFVLTTDKNWLELNPLTRAGLLEEQSQLDSVGITLTLQEHSF